MSGGDQVVTPEQARMICDAYAEAAQIVAEAVHRLVQAVVEAVRSVTAALADKFKEWLHALLRSINPKLYHLTFHSKKHRVRKKNLRRLLWQLATT